DGVGERAKHLLQVAAVAGQGLDEALLAEVSGLSGDDLGAALSTLLEGDFLRLLPSSPRSEYAFKHPLMRDVAYRSQLNEQRAQRHAAVATALERLRADRLGEHAALIPHPWGASGKPFEALRWKRPAPPKVANHQAPSPRP